MKTMITALVALLFASTANAFQVFDSNTTDLGQVSQVVCGTGVTCTVAGKKVTLATNVGSSLTLSGTLAVSGATTLTGGIGSGGTLFTLFSTWAPQIVTSATSATPSATAVAVTQMRIPHNETITGIAVLNAATCGTNKWIVALFDDTGAILANSALAGTLCSGASAYQKIAFTGTYAAKGPKTYWIALYADGATDRYYSIPTTGQGVGLAGSVTGQTFGTIAALTLPTTFTADKGPVAYVY